MKKFTALTMGALLFAAPVFAADANDVAEDARDVQADAGAIHKDNKDIHKHRRNMAEHRAQKARHKANGDYGSQAVDSVKLGVDHTMVGEKRAEKDVDTKILHRHQDNLRDDAAEMNSSR